MISNVAETTDRNGMLALGMVTTGMLTKGCGQIYGMVWGQVLPLRHGDCIQGNLPRWRVIFITTFLLQLFFEIPLKDRTLTWVVHPMVSLV